MPQNFEKVGENRYRETFGRYLEEIEVGDIYEHRPGRTITQTEMVWHALLLMAIDPLHINRDFMSDTEYGQPIVDGILVLGLCVGMSMTDWSYKSLGMLGLDAVEFTNPVFAGDTIYAESEVLHVRESESRPNYGVVSVRTTGYKQSGERVVEFERTALVPKREKSGDYQSHPGDE